MISTREYQLFGSNPLTDGLHTTLKFLTMEATRAKECAEPLKTNHDKPVEEKTNKQFFETYDVHVHEPLQINTLEPKKITRVYQIPTALFNLIPQTQKQQSSLIHSFVSALRRTAAYQYRNGDYISSAENYKTVCQHTVNVPDDWRGLLDAAVKIDFKLVQLLCRRLFDFKDPRLTQLARVYLAYLNNQVDVKMS